MQVFVFGSVFIVVTAALSIFSRVSNYLIVAELFFCFEQLANNFAQRAFFCDYFLVSGRVESSFNELSSRYMLQFFFFAQRELLR